MVEGPLCQEWDDSQRLRGVKEESLDEARNSLGFGFEARFAGPKTSEDLLAAGLQPQPRWTGQLQ